MLLLLIYFTFSNEKNSHVKIRLLGNHTITKEESVALFLIGLLVLLVGLRASSVGIDTETYSRIYIKLGELKSYEEALDRSTFWGPIYVICSKTLYFLNKSPQFLWFIMSLLTYWCLFIYFKKMSCNIAFSIFIWIGLHFLYFSMNGARQTLAIVLALNATVFWKEDKKSIKGWLLFALAIGIHPTSVVMMGICLCIFIEEKIASKYIVLLCSTLIGITVGVLYKNLVLLIIKFMPGYLKYVTSNKITSAFNSSGGGRIAALYVFLIFFCFLWGISNKSSNKAKGYFSGILIALIVGIINSRNTIITRLVMYYLPLACIFFPDFINQQKSYKKYLYLSGIIVVLLIYSIIGLNENTSGVVPYRMLRL